MQRCTGAQRKAALAGTATCAPRSGSVSAGWPQNIQSQARAAPGAAARARDAARSPEVSAWTKDFMEGSVGRGEAAAGESGRGTPRRGAAAACRGWRTPVHPRIGRANVAATLPGGPEAWPHQRWARAPAQRTPPGRRPRTARGHDGGRRPPTALWEFFLLLCTRRHPDPQSAETRHRPGLRPSAARRAADGPRGGCGLVTSRSPPPSTSWIRRGAGHPTPGRPGSPVAEYDGLDIEDVEPVVAGTKDVVVSARRGERVLRALAAETESVHAIAHIDEYD